MREFDWGASRAKNIWTVTYEKEGECECCGQSVIEGCYLICETKEDAEKERPHLGSVITIKSDWGVFPLTDDEIEFLNNNGVPIRRHMTGLEQSFYLFEIGDANAMMAGDHPTLEGYRKVYKLYEKEYGGKNAKKEK